MLIIFIEEKKNWQDTGYDKWKNLITMIKGLKNYDCKLWKKPVITAVI
jgi:hypothetical protein